jgi:two-component system sensor histidine kinase AtoS
VTLVLVLIGGSMLALVLTRRITRPLERLAEASGALARGELDRRFVEEGPDEIERLGRAFNVMAVSLSRTLRRLSQREAVAAIGEFASSLAHEVRNPLTSIRLDLERARERLADRNRAEELLTRALHQIDRLDETVGGSLRIARSGSLTMSQVHLQEPVQAAMRAAAPMFDARGARLVAGDWPGEAIVVRGNAGALEQLFLNLLLNAADALDGAGIARLEVEPSADGVCVTVRDNGRGIPPAALDRVWEPFYTTKADGTGLGLPIARRIAHAHGGELTIESTPGAGTTVRVHLLALPRR